MTFSSSKRVLQNAEWPTTTMNGTHTATGESGMRNRARVTCLQYAPMGALPYLTWAVVERHLPALAHTLVVPLASVYVRVGETDCYPHV